MRKIAILAVLALAAWCGLVLNARSQESCPQHFFSGQAPVVTREIIAERSRTLCFEAFAVLHSALSRGPVYAAEHLTKAGQQASHPGRVGVFHAEPRLQAIERSELHDYARSGYDRGHMAPFGDMSNGASQHESFSLANIVPQNGSLNRGLWNHIESQVRQRALKAGELYVITGPLFEGGSIGSLKGRVLIPTSIWKATLDPKTGGAWAVVVPNRDRAEGEEIAIDQLEARTGLRLFPGRPENGTF
jgi:endonuclease G